MTAPATSAPQAAREERLVSILGRASGRFRLVFTERTLAAIGGGLVVAGLVAVVVGYIGTSRTVLVSGQIPYVVSGGLFGLGLIFLGGFLYFAHWMAISVRERREQAAQDRHDLALLRDGLADLNRTLGTVLGVIGAGAGGTAGREALSATRPRPAPGAVPAEVGASLSAVGSPLSGQRGGTNGTGGVGSVVLVATQAGSMMHRPDCAAVAGRDNLREVSPADGLKPCGMCRPLEED